MLLQRHSENLDRVLNWAGNFPGHRRIVDRASPLPEERSRQISTLGSWIYLAKAGPHSWEGFELSVRGRTAWLAAQSTGLAGHRIGAKGP